MAEQIEKLRVAQLERAIPRRRWFRNRKGSLERLDARVPDGHDILLGGR